MKFKLRFCTKMNIMKSSLSVLICVNLFFWEYVTASQETIEINITSTVNSDEPLLLTKYIDSGDVKTGRKLSRTGSFPGVPDILSYNGFFTVDKKLRSNLFFWFFPALNNNKSAPLLLWLQGGPGISSLFGLFNEHGPYIIYENMTLGLREFSWAKSMHVLYVDNPVGTGFSFTKNDIGFSSKEKEIADNMYEFLRQFFTVFSEYRSNDFYITGESYGGKYVPSVAYKIHIAGPSSGINLKGIAVGNGLYNPEYMVYYGDYYYNLGLIDTRQAAKMDNISTLLVNFIKKKEFVKASEAANALFINNDSLAVKFTGFNYFYNFLFSEEPSDFKYFGSYIQLPEFRRAVHVGNKSFQGNQKVAMYLLVDMMKSVEPKIQVLMNNYKVMFYSGQLDLTIPYPNSINFLKNIDWNFAEEYRNAKRKIWKLPGTNTIAGYVHNVGSFYEILVRNAGHIVPHDQPAVALDLISNFVNNKPYF